MPFAIARPGQYRASCLKMRIRIARVHTVFWSNIASACVCRRVYTYTYGSRNRSGHKLCALSTGSLRRLLQFLPPFVTDRYKIRVVCLCLPRFRARRLPFRFDVRSFRGGGFADRLPFGDESSNLLILNTRRRFRSFRDVSRSCCCTSASSRV